MRSTIYTDPHNGKQYRVLRRVKMKHLITEWIAPMLFGALMATLFLIALFA